MSMSVSTVKTGRLFIAIPIPEQAQTELQKAVEQFPQYVERVVPIENWHLTLIFLGKVHNYHNYMEQLTEDLAQVFVPTVTITHVGRGLSRSQLWAFAQATSVLDNVRLMMQRRLAKLRIPLPARAKQHAFNPHIRLAQLFETTRSVGIADYSINITFTAKVIHVISSELRPEGARHTIEGTVRLVP